MIIDRLDGLNISALPRMVRWFDPILLAQTGVRAIISSVFGQYADQRAMQAAVDPIDQQSLVSRYDYSHELTPDASGAIWVDFVADLGDGFDSTYAIASLLAKPAIAFEGVGELKAGKILVMGGDQVYPFPSREDYRQRCHLPYELALPAPPATSEVERRLKRKLFIIPGNHDWYDGLVAFDYFFCAARQGASESKEIGGWLCPQHRSYFAVRLPNNWWIWGPDIQLSRYLDVGQIHYFSEVAKSMSAEDKVILCMAEPRWIETLYDPSRSPDSRGDNSLDRIITLATSRGARICTMLAGDLHHYARYSAERLGISLITAGGGGAFLHPTHQLPKKIDVNFCVNDEILSDKCTLASSPEGGLSCFPSRLRSRAVAFRNLFFSFINPWFCVGLGIIYWLVGWQYRTTNAAESLTTGKLETVTDWINCANWSFVIPNTWSVTNIANLTLLTAVRNFTLAILVLAMLAALYYYADAKRVWVKAILGFGHWLGHIAAIIAVAFAASSLNHALYNWRYSGSGINLSECPVKWNNPALDPTVSAFTAGMEMWLLGTLLGGVVWGAYLLVCGGFFGIHANDAFSSIRVPHYKNFLRLRIEPERLTIYPIGLKKVPSRRSWRKVRPARGGDSGSLLEPRTPLTPKLIEAPIVVEVAGVKRVANLRG